MDIAEFVSDYVAMLRDNGGKMPAKRKLAAEIAEAIADYGVTATPADILYYL